MSLGITPDKLNMDDVMSWSLKAPAVITTQDWYDSVITSLAETITVEEDKRLLREFPGWLRESHRSVRLRFNKRKKQRRQRTGRR